MTIFLGGCKTTTKTPISSTSSQVIRSDAVDDSLTFNQDQAIVIKPATLLANDITGYTTTTSANNSSGCWAWSGLNCFWQPHQGCYGSSQAVTSDSLSITSVQGAVNGTVSFNNGLITFVPIAGYSGPAQFTYTLSDGHGGTDVATVKMGINHVSHAPDAIDDVVVGQFGLPVIISPASILGNDKDVDGDKLSIVSVQGAENGKVALVNGNIVFTPNEGYIGAAKFTYTVSDGTTAVPNTTPKDIHLDFGNHSNQQDGIFKEFLSHWYTDHDGGKIEINSGAHVGMPQLGNLIDLGFSTGKSTNLCTKIEGEKGKKIDLDFDFCAKIGHGGQNNVMQVIVDGKLINTCSAKTAAFQHHSCSIVATGHPMHVEFRPLSQTSGCLLSNIAIKGCHGYSSQTDTALVTVNISPVAPTTAADMTDHTDTGISNHDDLTKNNTPDFAVVNPNNSIVNLYIDGVKVPSSYNSVTGLVTPVNPLADGEHHVTYTLSGGELNAYESTQSPPLVIQIDTLAPDMPNLAPDMTAPTDTGASNIDNLTADSTPDFEIVPPGSNTPTLYVDGVMVPTIFDAIHNTLTPTMPLADGPHEIYYTLTDAAGNESGVSSSLPVIIDTIAPSQPAAVDMTAETDTGVSNTDDITHDNTPDFEIEPTNGSTPSLYVDGVKVPALYNAVANTLTPITPLTDGPHNVSYSLTDASGNESPLSAPLPILIDTVAPNQPDALDMTSSTDTGMSNTDDVTSEKTPDFVIAPIGNQTPTLYVDGEKTASIYNPVTGTLTPVTPLPDGPHQVSYTLTDLAGNESQLSRPLPILIDSQAPTASAIAPDMTADTDTGLSSIDNNTDNTTPDFAIPAPGDNEPSLYIDGIKVPATYDSLKGTLTPVNPIADGQHEVSYTLTDVAGNESSLSPALPIVIGAQTPQNTAPDAIDDNLTGIKDTPLIITPASLLANDTDTDGDQVQGVSFQDPVNGTANFVDGNIVFTPTAGYTGPASFTYTIVDGKGGTDTATVNLTIEAPVNSAPVANDDILTIVANGPFALNPYTQQVLSNDFDPDGDKLAVISKQNVVGGSIDYIDDVAYFTPTPGYTGLASFEYTISDGKGGTDTALITMKITAPVNDAPDAKDDMFEGVKTGQVVINPSDLLANDSDVNGDAIQGVSLQDATNGTVEYVSGKVVFTPTAGYSGPASFTYTITDGKGGYDTATVKLTVDARVAPSAPTLAPDMTAETDTGVSHTDDLTRDNTPDFAISVPSGLNANLYVDGVKVPATFVAGVLTPTCPLSEGAHNITYTVTDTSGKESGQSPALPVMIDTQAPAQPLVAPDMTAATDTGPSNTDNNTDISKPDFAIPATNGNTPSLYVDGVKVPATFNFGMLTPVNTISNGQHQVSYTLTDAAGNESAPSPCLPIVVGAQIQPNHVPDAKDDYIDVMAARLFSLSPYAQQILANDTDADGDKIVEVSRQNVVGGSLQYIDGIPYFMPTPDYKGPASFEYTISDGKGGIDTATVHLNITPPISIGPDVASANHAPTAFDDSAVGVANVPFVIAMSDLLVNDQDADGDVLKGVSVQAPVNGTVEMIDGNVIFTPTAGYTGPASFTYSISDVKGGSDTATVNLTISEPPPSIYKLDFENIAPGCELAPPQGWYTDNVNGIEVLPTDVYYGINPSTQALELENKPDDAGNFYTFVHSDLGKELTLSFDYSAREGVSEGTNSAINLLVNGEVIATVNTHTVGFTHFDYKITGTGEPMRIEFQAIDKNAMGGILDNIFLENTYIVDRPVVQNTLPDAMDDKLNVTVDDNNLVVISPASLLGNDVDADGDVLQAVSFQNAVNGDVEIIDGHVVFKPADGYSGDASFSYTIADGKGGSDTATVNLHISQPEPMNVIGTDDDVLVGTSKNDLIIGGAGNDQMTGGLGADTFSWSLADTNAAGVEVDTITDFSMSSDVINLKDLLTGESHNAGSLENYLHFSVENGNTTLYVSAGGQFGDNNSVGGSAQSFLPNTTQQIVFSGVDLTLGGSSDAQVIQNLLANNKMITD